MYCTCTSMYVPTYAVVSYHICIRTPYIRIKRMMRLTQLARELGLCCMEAV